MFRLFGNLGIDISALASASASTFGYKYCFLHSIRSLLKASSIYFVKHVVSNKVATYRLEACDFVRKYFAKISRRKFPDNLKRVTMKNPYAKTSVLESVFNEIAWINSRLTCLMKKSLHQRHLPLNILELSALLQEGVTQAPFSHIILRAAHNRVATLLGRWSTIDFFSQSIVC